MFCVRQEQMNRVPAAGTSSAWVLRSWCLSPTGTPGHGSSPRMLLRSRKRAHFPEGAKLHLKQMQLLQFMATLLSPVHGNRLPVVPSYAALWIFSVYFPFLARSSSEVCRFCGPPERENRTSLHHRLVGRFLP